MRISDWSSDVCSSDLRIGVADPVEYRLGLLAGGDQIVLTQFSEVLRKGGLAQPDALRQIADGQLAFLGQEAEDQQARFIAHHFQQAAGLAGLAREIRIWSPSLATGIGRAWCRARVCEN